VSNRVSFQYLGYRDLLGVGFIFTTCFSNSKMRDLGNLFMLQNVTAGKGIELMSCFIG